MLDEIVPKKPPIPEETFGDPMKWKITGTSTLLLIILRTRASFLMLSSFNFAFSSAWLIPREVSDEFLNLSFYKVLNYYVLGLLTVALMSRSR